jgi:hypothetical protein
MDTEALVPQADGSHDTLSRRKALKRLGLAAGAAWAAPLFMTSTAQAAGTGDLTCLAAGLDVGGDPCKACPACDTTCGGNDQDHCCCFIDVKGCCFCGNNFPCESAQACKKTRDCPAGWRCVYTCCGGVKVTACAPPCPAATSLRTKATGRMAGTRS